MIHSIAHPSDFSTSGQIAFEHALRLALLNRCRLDILHVRSPHAKDDWDHFPRVREVLTRWGFLEPGSCVENIPAATGIEVRKVEIRDAEAYEGLSRFMLRHRPDLIVMASHGRAGLGRWVKPSVYAEVEYDRSVPALIFGPAARPFVDTATGQIELKRVLVPVDGDPDPGSAVRVLDSLVEGLDVELDFLHVGAADFPDLPGAQGQRRAVRRIDGSVIDTILDQAREAGLIAMPMIGCDGLLDAIRGSTSERIVHAAASPVLLLPALSPRVDAIASQLDKDAGDLSDPEDSRAAAAGSS